jgi:long-subunit acyl-CoA synthetase (AMP-forming)
MPRSDVASPPNLPAALLHRAATDPEEPWLFRSEGWDWVWYPWGELTRWMDGWRDGLSALPAGARAGFDYVPRPEFVVLDLAIQAAGLVSVPGERGEGDFWVEIESGAIKASPPGPTYRPDPPLLEASRPKLAPMG